MGKYNEKRILVTGCAGFIGMHISRFLLDNEFSILGIDNLNDYYDIGLKNDRVNILKEYRDFKFDSIDISNFESLSFAFKSFKPSMVVNLAAQAGVRYSISNPDVYIESNVKGFMNVLECCKSFNVEGLIYASSSSVYGGNIKIPFSELDSVINPVSIYATSKISNELMARCFYNLYGLKSTGLRFFTVYGPWGRPDMAYFDFTKNIINQEPIHVYNYGNMERDFTYIDDIVLGIYSSILNNYDCEIINLGNNNSEKLLDFISVIEKLLNKKAIIEFKSMQPGDVEKTYANIDKAKNLLSFQPKTKINEGLKSFISWYKNYYRVD